MQRLWWLKVTQCCSLAIVSPVQRRKISRPTYSRVQKAPIGDQHHFLLELRSSSGSPLGSHACIPVEGRLRVLMGEAHLHWNDGVDSDGHLPGVCSIQHAQQAGKALGEGRSVGSHTLLERCHGLDGIKAELVMSGSVWPFDCNE